MKRFGATVALALGLAVAAHAQTTTTTKTETKSSGGEAKTVTYTGCVETGTQAKTYVLNQAIPTGQTTSISAEGAGATTVTTYALVPAETVTVQEHVGQKVEVTGTMVPGGDIKSTTSTKVEREHADDSKTVQTTKSDNAMPQFHVTSIKQLPGSCQ